MWKCGRAWLRSHGPERRSPRPSYGSTRHWVHTAQAQSVRKAASGSAQRCEGAREWAPLASDARAVGGQVLCDPCPRRVRRATTPHRRQCAPPAPCRRQGVGSAHPRREMIVTAQCHRYGAVRGVQVPDPTVSPRSTRASTSGSHAFDHSYNRTSSLSSGHDVRDEHCAYGRNACVV